VNIFVLDLDARAAARLHCDRPVVKMPTETAQLMCTALAVHGRSGLGYKPTHVHHPCALWAARSRANFEWLGELGLELVEEHGRRYAHTAAGRRGHAAGPVLREALGLRASVPAGALTDFAQAMPDERRGDDVVEAYRRYYRLDKQAIATWRAPSTRPDWMD